ncbi:MAG: AI-2E family transporter [Dokdonella sp.]
MSDLARQVRILTRSMLVILLIVCTYACYLAQDVLAPLMLGLLLALLLSPLVTLFEHARVPRALGSLVVVLLIVVGMGAAISALTRPAQDWIANAPKSFKSIEQRLRDVRAPLTQAREATRKLEDMGQPPASKVVVATQPSALDGMLAATPHVVGTIAVVLLLVYFFLSSGDNFLRRLVEISPGMSEKRVVVGIARGIQQEMSRYLVMVSSINLGLAIATAIAMTLLGVPNALLWGALAGVLNFAPYVGPTLTIITLTLVGLATFPTIGHMLAVPAVFFVLAVIEGQIITPYVIGRRLAINPVIVFIWLLVWGALWGVIGILLAGPLLACFRILCQHLPSLQPMSVLMGDSRTEAVE